MILSARDFLRHHFKNSAGYVEFRLIKDGKITQHYFTPQETQDSWDKIESRLRAANDKGVNIYFGVSARTDKKGDAAHAPLCHCLWVDIDFKGPTAKKNLEILKAFKLIPNILTNSGRGWHLYWYLKEPIPYAEAEPVLDQLIRVLGGDQNCKSAPRVMRLPSFLNTKRTPHVICTVERYDFKREFNPSDFDPLQDAAAGEYPAGEAPKKPTEKPSSPALCSALLREVYGNGHGFAYMMAQFVAPYWKDGSRHQFTLGLSGLLRKGEVSREGAIMIVQKVCEMAGDQEVADRLTAVKTTYAAKEEEIAASSVIEAALGKEGAREFFGRFNAILKELPPPPVIRKALPDFDLYECVPPGSPFEKYVAYAWEKTDAPIQFHVGSFLTVAAAALGNRVYTDYNGSNLFPNLYTILTGPSSRFRKSTSIDIARKIAKAANVEAYPNNATVEQLYARFAPCEDEVIEEDMGPNRPRRRKVVSWKGSPAGIIYHREFASWLSSTGKSYMQGMRDFFMDLYDGAADRSMGSRETKTSGRYYIEDPAISMICGVTPASVREFITKTDTHSGFLPRFLVVMHPKTHKNRRGLNRAKNDDLDTAMELTRFLEKLKEAKGSMDISLEAEEVLSKFQDWTMEKIEEIENTPLAVLDGFLTRLLTMAVKVGMIYARARGVSIVDTEDMTYATAFCRWSARGLEHFFEEVRPEEGNREMKYLRQVLDAARGIVKREGPQPIPHRTLLQYSNLTADQFKQATETLDVRGELRRIQRGGGRRLVYQLREIESDE